MVVIPVLLLVLLVPALGAQDAPALEKARQEAARIRALVEAGAEPRSKLEQAAEAVADAEDVVELERTLYGTVGLEEMTEEQSEGMVQAAERRRQRQQRRVEEVRKLVEAGAAARHALEEERLSLEERSRTVEMASRRAELFRELQEMARAEQELERVLEHQAGDPDKIAERYDGDGAFDINRLARIMTDYERQFGKPLPISARGATAFHRSLGLDHRGRVDVAVSPDAPEGMWLRRYLESARIPYFAFRAAVPGKSTGAHIHIGPPSLRIRTAD